MKPQVLIVVSAFWTGVSRLPSLLHAAGCQTTVLGHPSEAINHTRYTHHLLPVTAGRPAIFQELKKIVETQPNLYQWIILADGPTITTAQQFIDEPWMQKIFPMPAHIAKIHKAESKASFIKTMADAQIPTPRAITFSDEPSLWNAIQHVGYPLIVKNETDWGGSGHHVLRSDQDAKLLLPKLKPRTYVAQQLVTGRVGATDILYHHGQPLCWSSSFKYRCWPEPYGPSSSRLRAEIPQMKNYVTRLGQTLQFHGLLDLEWMLDPQTNQFYAIEINPRPTAALHLFPKLGSNLPAAIASMLAGHPQIFEPSPPPPKPFILSMFPQDAKRHIGRGEWLSALARALCLTGPNDFPWHDPPLLWYQTKHLLHQILRKIQGKPIW